MSTRDIIKRVVSRHLGETYSSSRRLASKKLESNFTAEKLDYKSKQDFWEVDDDGYIVRTFNRGEIIDES